VSADAGVLFDLRGWCHVFIEEGMIGVELF
jgi:hypothetical protein